MKLLVRRIGNSLGVIVPKSTLDAWGLGEGDSLELTERGIRPTTRPPLSLAELDEHKRNLAAAVVARFSANHIRAQGLSNLHRWKKKGAGLPPAYAEWEHILSKAPDGELFELLLGRDDRSNRLRQSPPYVGLLPPDEIKRLNEQAAGCSSHVEWLNAVGQDSPLHRECGYYADPLGATEATHRERLISLLGDAPLDRATRERIRAELERDFGVPTEA
jgi:antitoxin component of MazEF toxin-antitoxin module